MEKIRVLVADDVPQTRKDITRLLYFEEDIDVVGEAGDGEQTLQRALQLSPDVILMDINMPKMDGIAAAEKISLLLPHTAVVIISIHGETEYMKKAMFAGARDYLVKPLSSEDMATAVRNVYRQQQQREKKSPAAQAEILQAGYREVAESVPAQTMAPAQAVQAVVETVPPPEVQSLVETAPPLPEDTPVPAASLPGDRPRAEQKKQQSPPELPQAAVSRVQEDKPLSQIITVFSGKGGVGKTTLATNLAVVMAQSGKKKVALVDLDLQFGDIAVMLNLTDGKSISELARDKELSGGMCLDDYMIRHFTGIDILTAPLYPQEAEYVRPEHVESILKALKQAYDYIIVDSAAAFHDISLQLLDLSDQILLVVSRDIATIKDAKVSLNILESLGLREKVRIVLNRADQDLGVEIADLEKGLEVVVTHQLPGDERVVVSAINKGVPLVISQPSSELAKAFKRMNERVVSGKRLSPSDKQGKHLINRIFSL
jgi:pilus assembly protein CpaE